MKIFEITKRFPKEERYGLTDQIRKPKPSDWELQDWELTNCELNLSTTLP